MWNASLPLVQAFWQNSDGFSEGTLCFPKAAPCWLWGFQCAALSARSRVARGGWINIPSSGFWMVPVIFPDPLRWWEPCADGSEQVMSLEGITGITTLLFFPWRSSKERSLGACLLSPCPRFSCFLLSEQHEKDPILFLASWMTFSLLWQLS